MTQLAPVTSEDRDDWFELFGAYLVFYETELTSDVIDATFASLLDADANVHGAIARDDDGVAVGLVHWLTHPSTWTATDYCYLEDLYVTPDTRGHGLGRALIAHVREWAEQHGSSKLYWLTAETNTTAQTLYDKVATKTGFIHYEIELE